MRSVTIPAIERASAFGVDPAFVIFIANTVVMLVLASFTFSARLYDPGRTGGFSARLRRRAAQDPLNFLLLRWKGFRSVGDPDLRPVFSSLVTGPVTGVVALGVLIGTLLVSAVSMGGAGLKAVVIGLAYILPHGLPEVAGLLLGSALPVSCYMRIKNEVEQGQVEAAFAGLKKAGAADRSAKVLGVAVSLLFGAALIEAHATNAAAHFVEALF